LPRRISLEERIRRLEENKEYFIKQRVEAFEKRLRAMYNARIDLLKTMGPKTKPKEKVHRTLEEMMDKAKERYIFFRKRFYEYMGLDPDEAKRRAEYDYQKYRQRWLSALME